MKPTMGWLTEHQNAIAVAIGGFLLLLVVALMFSTYNSAIVPLKDVGSGAAMTSWLNNRAPDLEACR